MPVEDNYEPVRLQADGILTAFAFPWNVTAETDLRVYTVVRADDSSKTLKTLTTHYTVSIDSDFVGGTVTFLSAPAATLDVLIEREVPYTQTVEAPHVGFMHQNKIQLGLDRMEMQLQQIRRSVGLAIKLSEELASGIGEDFDFELPTPVEGELRPLLMDENGIQLGGADLTDLTTALATANAASASASTASVTATTQAGIATSQAAAAAVSAAQAASAADATIRPRYESYDRISISQALNTSGAYTYFHTLSAMPNYISAKGAYSVSQATGSLFSVGGYVLQDDSFKREAGIVLTPQGSGGGDGRQYPFSEKVTTDATLFYLDDGDTSGGMAGEVTSVTISAINVTFTGEGGFPTGKTMKAELAVFR